MNISKIRKIIETGENQETEFKVALPKSDEIGKSVTSFANTQGGMVFFGVSNNRKLAGLEGNLDQLQQKISSAVQAISPVPQVRIDLVELDQKNIIFVQIQPSSEQSFYTYHGAIYVRLGSTVQRLDGRSQLEFLRNKQLLSFDETVNTEFDVTDIDIVKVEHFLTARNQPSYLKTHTLENFLISQKLAKKEPSFAIKNSTVLLFSSNPTFFYPQAEIKLVKFVTDEAVDIASHRLLQTDLATSIEEAIQFIQQNISKAIEIKSYAKRKEHYEYPLTAIREVVINAIVHRDYFSNDAIQISIFADRLEVVSPGGLPRGMTKDIFGTISVQRNPIIYRILRDLGYVEGLGTGIPRIKNELRRAELVDPIFTSTDWFFKVTFYNKKGSKKSIESHQDLNDRQRQALLYLQKHPSIKATTYAEINTIAYSTAANDIREMIEFGYLKKIGTYRGAYYVLK